MAFAALTVTMPHAWAEIVETTPNANAFLADVFGVTVHGDGDRMQPVVAGVLDDLVAWLEHGTPPPPSRIDGAGVDTDSDAVRDGIAFAQASGPPTLLVPSVFDPALDVYVGEQLPLTVAEGFGAFVGRYLQILAAVPHAPALSLPKETCRLGGFRISDFLSDSELLPFNFSAHWKNEGAYNACVTHAENVATEGAPQHLPHQAGHRPPGRLGGHRVDRIGSVALFDARPSLLGGRADVHGNAPSPLCQRCDEQPEQDRRDNETDCIASRP